VITQALSDHSETGKGGKKNVAETEKENKGEREQVGITNPIRA